MQYRNKLRKIDLENLYTKDYVPVAGGLIYDFLKKYMQIMSGKI